MENKPEQSSCTVQRQVGAQEVAADALAYACARAVCEGFLDSRSNIADALLDYLEIGSGGHNDVPSWMAEYEAKKRPNPELRGGGTASGTPSS